MKRPRASHLHLPNDRRKSSITSDTSAEDSFYPTSSQCVDGSAHPHLVHGKPHHNQEGDDVDPAFSILTRKRHKLPWLDGNNNSHLMPCTYNGEFQGLVAEASPGYTDEQPTGVNEATMYSNKQSVLAGHDPAIRPYGSTSSLTGRSRPQEARKHHHSLDSTEAFPRESFNTRLAPGAVADTLEDDLPAPQGLYLPTHLYAESPLGPKSTLSHEKLTNEPQHVTHDPPRSPTWPMVPLTETDIPARMSSLSFSQSTSPPRSIPRQPTSPRDMRSSTPSSLGRYIDGTISRKPTVKSRVFRSNTVSRPGDTSAARKPMFGPSSSELSASSDVSPRTMSPTSTSSVAETQDLQRAVTGLHNLMQEALSAATQAAAQHQSAEVAHILGEATLALRQSNNVQGRMATGGINRPLQVSDHESEIGASSSDDYTADASGSDTDSEVSSTASARAGFDEVIPSSCIPGPSNMVMPAATHLASRDRQPTLGVVHPESKRYSVMKQPMLSPPYEKNGRRPTSEQGFIDTLKPPPDLNASSSSSEARSVMKTPPAMYLQPSTNPAVRDWAYTNDAAGQPTMRDVAGEASHQGETLALPPQAHPIPVSPPAPVQMQPQEQRNATVRRDTGGPRQNDAWTKPRGLDLPEIPRKRTINPALVVSPPNASNSPLTPDREGITPLRPGEGGARRRHAPQPVSRIFESSNPNIPSDPGNEGGLEPRKSRHHISLGDNETFRLHRYRRQPIAREWKPLRKRVTAAVACINTALVGLIVGIYAGEVPKIQYQLADEHHRVILGNVLLYVCMGISTLVAWPLPLLHGRKPYTLAALAIAIPLQFPQAQVVSSYRSPETKYYVGLLLPRAITGFALGFAHINFLTTLFDIFGASLQSSNPHQEFVIADDPRRQGGGMGLWLGVWAWCFVGSLSLGFTIGAGITAHTNPAWGFYVVVILLAVFMVINVIIPEPRRAPYRRSVMKYLDKNEKIKRRVARGEVKLHLHMDGPKYWWEEVSAGFELMAYMMSQPGFFILAMYLAWIYALVVLVTLLLGALLSRDYMWGPQYIGLAVLAVAIGAALAVPLTKANIFSRDRMEPPRTDSGTFKPRVSWTSHLVRRCIFTFALPVAGLIYLFCSPGRSVHWSGPTIMSGVIGFLSCLAVAECVGLIMETFDTSDLQPGVNSKHRLQSMESATRRRRTNYSSYPRVAAGVFVTQAIGFFLAAAFTGVSGRMTRAIGAQAATGVVVGVLLLITICLSAILWRWKSVQVVPNHALGTMRSSRDWQQQEAENDPYFKPVIIGNPSGKMRRMNVLEMGSWSRWTEIRKLNKLIKHKKTG